VAWSNDTNFYLVWADGWKPGHAYYFDDEYFWDYYAADHIYVYDNFASNAWTGLWWAATHVNSPIDSWHAFNNTFVDCYRGVSLIVLASDQSTNSITNSQIRNNLFYCPSGSCINYSGPTVTNGLVWSNNLWPAVSAYPYAGAGDIINANAQLTKIADWRTIAAGIMSSNDFKLQVSSPAINKGVALGASYNTDYFGTTRPQGSAWDIGAHEYGASGGDTTAPGVPSGLNVR
jgi:hypothetical protein